MLGRFRAANPTNSHSSAEAYECSSVAETKRRWAARAVNEASLQECNPPSKDPLPPPPPPRAKQQASSAAACPKGKNDGKQVAKMARQGDEVMLKYLYTLDQEERTRLKRCALCEAATNGLMNCTMLLLEWGADPNDGRPNSSYKNALHEACNWSKSNEAVIALLLAARGDPDSKGKTNQTAHSVTPRKLAMKAGLEHLLPPPPIEEASQDLIKEEVFRTCKDVDEIRSHLEKLKEDLAHLQVTASDKTQKLQKTESPKSSSAMEWLNAASDAKEEQALDEALAPNLELVEREENKTMWTWNPPGRGTSFWSSYTPPGVWPKTKLKATRKELPIDAYRPTIVKMVSQHPITILRGETGSGKSTQVPQYLLDVCPEEACVVVCQPRRIAAISLAARVAHERGEEMGHSVGYHIGGEVVTAWPQGSITFCTEGTLLRRLRNGASGVSHFVLDEAHERSMELDLLLCILRTVASLHNRTHVDSDGKVHCGTGPRLIVMSATVDTLRMMEYFRMELEPGLEVGVVDVPGKLFPIVSYYLEDMANSLHEMFGQECINELKKKGKTGLPPGVWNNANANARWSSDASQDPSRYAPWVEEFVRGVDDRYIQLGIAACMIRLRIVNKEVHSNHKSNAVLLFLPGVAEIRAAKQFLIDDPVTEANTIIIELHSKAPPESQAAAFAPSAEKLKVILATNIAETSITIPDVDWVMDAGLIRVKDHGALDTIWEGKSNAKQRAGRSGRVRYGECFYLFTKMRHDELVEHIPPEIQRQSLSRVVLLTLEMGVGATTLLKKTLDPPTTRQLRAANMELHEIRATTSFSDDKDAEITGLGRVLNSLVLEPRVGLALVAALVVGLEFEMAMLLAVIGSSKEVTNVINESALDGDINDESVRMGCRSDLFCAAMVLCVVLQCEGEDRHKTITNLKLPVHQMIRTIQLIEQLRPAIERYSGKELDCSKVFYSLRNNAHRLSALLAFGFGNNVAIDKGGSNLKVSSGKGKAARESRWLGAKNMQEGEMCALLYGSTVPMPGWKSQLICKDVTQTALLAVLLFSTNLNVVAEGFLEVGGWLQVKGFAIEDCKLITIVREQLQGLIAECGNRLTLRQSMQQQQAAWDAYAERLLYVREALPTLIDLAWRSESTALSLNPPDKGSIVGHEDLPQGHGMSFIAGAMHLPRSSLEKAGNEGEEWDIYDRDNYRDGVGGWSAHEHWYWNRHPSHWEGEGCWRGLSSWNHKC